MSKIIKAHGSTLPPSSDKQKSQVKHDRNEDKQTAKYKKEGLYPIVHHLLCWSQQVAVPTTQNSGRHKPFFFFIYLPPVHTHKKKAVKSISNGFNQREATDEKRWWKCMRTPTFSFCLIALCGSFSMTTFSSPPHFTHVPVSSQTDEDKNTLPSLLNHCSLCSNTEREWTQQSSSSSLLLP